MTREQAELGEDQHNAQFRNEDGIDAQGFYPGEREWREKHKAEVEAREKAEAEDAERSLQALLAEIECD